MNNYSKIIFFFTIFFIFIILLWLLGVVNTNLIELSAYFSIVLGIILFLTSFGNNKSFALFNGTIIFFLGLVFFILNSFDFIQHDKIILPSFIFIIGTGFFTLFLDDYSKKRNLFVSVFFWLFGLIYVLLAGQYSFTTFISSIIEVSYSFWIVILLVIGIFIFLNNYSKK